jgi:hypothetical protein
MKLWQEILLIPSSIIAIMCEKRFVKTKYYQETLANFIEVGQFGCFDASIIMHDI